MPEMENIVDPMHDLTPTEEALLRANALALNGRAEGLEDEVDGLIGQVGGIRKQARSLKIACDTYQKAVDNLLLQLRAVRIKNVELAQKAEMANKAAAASAEREAAALEREASANARIKDLEAQLLTLQGVNS